MLIIKTHVIYILRSGVSGLGFINRILSITSYKRGACSPSLSAVPKLSASTRNDGKLRLLGARTVTDCLLFAAFVNDTIRYRGPSPADGHDPVLRLHRRLDTWPEVSLVVG